MLIIVILQRLIKQMLIGLLSSFISTRLRCFHLAPPSTPSKLTTWCSIFYYLSYLLWIPNKSLSQTSFIASFYLISTHKIYSHGHDYDFYYKYYIVLSLGGIYEHVSKRLQFKTIFCSKRFTLIWWNYRHTVTCRFVSQIFCVEALSDTVTVINGVGTVYLQTCSSHYWVS